MGSGSSDVPLKCGNIYLPHKADSQKQTIILSITSTITSKITTVLSAKMLSYFGCTLQSYLFSSLAEELVALPLTSAVAQL